MNARNWILPLAMLTGLGSVYLLPQAGTIAESAVRMELPDSLDGWKLTKRPPSEDEVGALEKGTEFSKAECLKARPGEYSADGRLVPDLIDLSIVLSGTDLNNSIHRPERCMPAQGHSIKASSDLMLTDAGGNQFPVKRLQSERVIHNNKKETVGTLKCVTYYFFVGHDQITNDHVGRTMIDMKDRLLRGMDQRWAYVSISTYFGELPWIRGKSVSETEADAKLAKFAGELAGDAIRWDMIRKN